MMINIHILKSTRVPILAAIMLTVLAIMFTGCVGNKKFTEVQQERDQLQSDLSACQQKNNALQRQVDQAQNEQEERMASLQSENEELEDELAEARASIAELSSELANCPTAMQEGVYFKVQIGAFREREVSENLEESVNLDVEETDGLQEIVVGQFRDYYMADSLQNQLRAMGVSDAWIVPYRDGQRVPLKEVLDEIEE